MQSLFDLIRDEPVKAARPAARSRRRLGRPGMTPEQRRGRGIDRWLQGRSLALQKVNKMNPADADAKAIADWLALEEVADGR